MQTEFLQSAKKDSYDTGSWMKSQVPLRIIPSQMEATEDFQTTRFGLMTESAAAFFNLMGSMISWSPDQQQFPE